MGIKLDRTNQRYGRLTALRESATRIRDTLTWTCRCDCGNAVDVPANDLASGNTVSCGCYRVDRGREHGARIGLKHGAAGGRTMTPEYRIWCGIRQRCLSEKNPHWRDYGGRGIALCERWREFANFLLDMGPRPSPKHTLDRKDNDGPYSPDNCQWATGRQQNTNKRNSAPPVTIDGVTKLIVEWCEHFGISRTTYRQRVKAGMEPAQALSCARMPTEYRRKPERTRRDLTGMVVNRLTVLSFDSKRTANAYWKCLCACGKECVAQASALMNGTAKSCGCARGARKSVNMAGMRFGRLVVVEQLRQRDNTGRVMWLCDCDCGDCAAVSTTSLTSGNTKSCGCARRDLIREAGRAHRAAVAAK